MPALTSVTGKNLKELQACELEILKDFIKVCNKLNLSYYLCGGTCLGCIRHQGFIPWDDDIDVCMPRKDYDTFIKKAQPLLKKSYFLQTYETDPEYTMGYAKIRDTNTTFVESSCRKQNINHGVFIDIFQLDNYEPNAKIKNLVNEKLLLLNRIKISRSYSVKSKNILKNIIPCLPYSKTSIQKNNRKNDNIAKTYIKTNTNYYKIYHGPNDKGVFYSKSLFGKPKEKLFEGIKVNVPEKYHEYLTQFYGNYMQLPPKKDRVAHHFISKFDLTKPYTTKSLKK